MEGTDDRAQPTGAADRTGTDRFHLTRRQLFAAAGTTSLAAVLASGLPSPAAGASPAAPAHNPPALGATRAFRSRPDLRPAVVSSSVVQTPSTGLVCITAGGPQILDDHGEPVFVRTVPHAATNLRVQSYDAKPVLTWWEGKISKYGVGVSGEDVLVDTSYHEVARVRAGHGLAADLHECTLTERGTALITAYARRTADLSAVGGPRHGPILEAHAQEVDVATGKVLFDWNSSAHIALSESYSTYSSTSPYDPVHLNSIDVLPDGNLLISARNTWAIYKVDRKSGRIHWRLGGKKSDFSLGPHVRFAWQHHATWHPGSILTVFDDEAAPAKGPQSRGLILHVDMAARHVSLVRAYVHPTKKLLAGYAGSVQLLDNGDVFIGWGQEPYATEYRRDGAPVLDATFTGFSYRAFRCDWHATPSDTPAVAVEPDDAGLVAYVSWNGATDVASWRVLGGSAPSALAPIATAPRNGFETALRLPGAPAWVAAQSLDSAGSVMATSAPVSAAPA